MHEIDRPYFPRNTVLNTCSSLYECWGKVADPDPYFGKLDADSHFGKLDLDPDPHFWKLDPDPHLNEKLDPHPHQRQN